MVSLPVSAGKDQLLHPEPLDRQPPDVERAHNGCSKTQDGKEPSDASGGDLGIGIHFSHITFAHEWAGRIVGRCQVFEFFSSFLGSDQDNFWFFRVEDQDIVELFSRLPTGTRLIVGLDAPLSYNPGGGDRLSDKALRKETIARGMHPGNVMTPTNTRMVYLTLRGLAIARLLESIGHPRLGIVEVHPGAAMVLGGADLFEVRSMKRAAETRQSLLRWIEREGVGGIAGKANPTDHFVASCACALAAWKWSRGKSSWVWRAELPHHPYDFAC